MIEARRAQWPDEPMPLTTVSLLPPGSWRTWIPGEGWTGIMAGRGGVDAAFTDGAGTHWIRRALGDLRELAEPPLEYFAKQGLYPPHELQAPEPDG
jgi:hypothetical protein